MNTLHGYLFVTAVWQQSIHLSSIVLKNLFEIIPIGQVCSPILATLDWTTHLYPSAYTTVGRFNTWSILLFTLVLFLREYNINNVEV
jgi:hypothetical protein